MKFNAKNDGYIEQIINDPNYDIRETGEVFTVITRTGKKSVNNVWRNCVSKGQFNYKLVYYKYKALQLHRIIFRKFKGSLDSSLQINHIDGHPENNHIDNLELVTNSQNQLHSYRVLKNPAVFGNCKITKEIADKIREDYKTIKSYKLLVEKYSLSKSLISYIINDKVWK